MTRMCSSARNLSPLPAAKCTIVAAFSTHLTAAATLSAAASAGAASPVVLLGTLAAAALAGASPVCEGTDPCGGGLDPQCPDQRRLRSRRLAGLAVEVDRHLREATDYLGPMLGCGEDSAELRVADLSAALDLRAEHFGLVTTFYAQISLLGMIFPIFHLLLPRTWFSLSSNELLYQLLTEEAEEDVDDLDLVRQLFLDLMSSSEERDPEALAFALNEMVRGGQTKGENI